MKLKNIALFYCVMCIGWLMPIIIWKNNYLLVINCQLAIITCSIVSVVLYTGHKVILALGGKE